MKRQNIKVYLIFVFVFSFFLEPLFGQVGGYVDKFSVAKGDSITFFISTTADDSSSLAFNFFQITNDVQFKKTYTISAGFQPTPDSSFYYGCNWQPTYKLQIPMDWSPGVYRAEFHRSGTAGNYESYGVLFIVKPQVLASFSNVLLIVATNTFQAYNTYGGQSLYEQFPAPGDTIPRSRKVSTQRPADLPLGFLGSADFYKYERRFINWAFTNNINLEYASKYDLDADPDFLANGSSKNYEVVFIAGHNEYWSKQERDQCENYLSIGGKIIIISGNTCWWQVRFEDNGNTMVCYKDSTDPIYNTNPSLVTTNWWKSPVNNPENSFTGVNFKDGGYVNSGYKLPHPLGFGDYAAFNTQHWVFDQTGLRDGDEFGYDDAIVGYEADGTRFGWDNKGLPVPLLTDNDQTPANFRILGASQAYPFDSLYILNISPNKFPHATMGFYYTGNKGALFNGATTDWSDGLLTDAANNNYPDTTVDRITKNVLYKFLENRFPPEITDWSPSLKYLKHINGDPIFYNVRDTIFSPLPASVQLSVTASNPFASQGIVNYAWFADGINQNVSNSTFEYTFPQTFAAVKKHTITAYGLNNEDTSSISWNFFTQPVVVDTEPNSRAFINVPYIQKFRVFHLYNDVVTFSLTADTPDWLSISADSGILKGTPPAENSFSIGIIATGNSGEKDTLIYTLTVTLTAIEDEITLPETFLLSQNYPNPFNPTTIINFTIPVESFVTLKVYDLLGRVVRTLLNEEKSAGSYKINFDAANLPSGIYFYRIAIHSDRLTSGNYSAVKKMILLK